MSGPRTAIGPFVVIEETAGGFVAFDPELGRKVAVKLLDPGQRQEAQLLARLSHPNVVAVHQLGNADGEDFVVMELVEGGTLRDWLARAPRSWREIRDRFVLAGHGLAAAHGAGVVHRDFKADSVLIGTDGRVRVTDFGGGDPKHELGPGDDQRAFAAALREALGDGPAWLRRAVAPGRALRGMEALLDDLTRDRRLARWGVGMAGIAAAAAAVAVVSSLVGGGQEMCRGAEERLAGAWDPDVRAAVRERFVSTGARFADDSFARAADALDAYTREWSAMYAQACEATSRGEQSSEALDLRMSCLTRRLDDVRALTLLFRLADVAMVTQSARASSSLPDVAPCADVSSLAAPVPPPADPVAQGAVATARKLLAGAEARYLAGRYRGAWSLVAPILPLASALAYPPLEGEVRYLAGRIFVQIGDQRRAEAELRAAEHAAEIGRDDELRAAILSELMVLTGMQDDRVAEALDFAARATSTLDRVGDRPVRRAVIALELGALYQRQGKFGESRLHGALALAIFERVLPATDFRIADALNSLGNACLLQGKYAEAAVLGTRALAIAEKALGPNHPNMAILVGNLAITVHSQGDYDRALALYERALAISERALGPDHLQVAHDLAGVATVLGDRGDLTAAAAQLERAVAMDQRLIPGSIEAVELEEILGDVYRLQGRYDVALAAHEHVLAVREKLLPPEHHLIARARGKLGELWLRMGEQDRALALLLRARDATAQALGPRHPAIAPTHAVLAEVLSRLGRHDEALASARLAVSITIEANGPEDPDVGDMRRRLGDVLHAKGMWREALDEQTAAAAITEKSMGPAHVGIAAPLTGMGRAQIALGEPALALAPLERALGLREHGQGDPLDLADTRLVLAEALWASGRDRDRARSLATNARAVYAAAGAAGKSGLAEADRWLARHR